MSVHLITGYKGEEHIQSQDTRSFNAAMFGDGEFVMEIGEQLEGSIIDNNTVRLLDGDILMQGGHIRIESGTFEDLTIDTGEAGYYRNDLIVMTYEKNAEDTTETAYLEVVKGTPTSGTPDDPEYTVGVLADGDLKNQMPLYRVKIEGVVLSDIESLFDTIPTYKTLALEAAATYKAKLEALRGTDILDTYEEIDANTQSLKFAGAIGVKQGIDSVKSSLTKIGTYYRFPTTGASEVTATNAYQGYTLCSKSGIPDGLYLVISYAISTNVATNDARFQVCLNGSSIQGATLCGGGGFFLEFTIPSVVNIKSSDTITTTIQQQNANGHWAGSIQFIRIK